MSDAVAALEDPTGRALRIVRAGVVVRDDGADVERVDAGDGGADAASGLRPIEAADAASGLRRIEAAYADGVLRLGGMRLHGALEAWPIARRARWRGEVRCEARAPVTIERVALVLEWACDADAEHRFLRNGWQSWSKSAVERIVDGGDDPFPSGAWLRGMHHAVGERAPGRDDWHESHAVTAVTAGGACAVAGVLETGRQLGLVNLRRVGGGAAAARIEVEIEWVVERRLAPGEVLTLEEAFLAVGRDENELLEAFATAWGHAAGARTKAAFQAGWCSWYHFFHDVTEEALLRNLDGLARRRDELPVDLVQLDDGYQRAIGDWLETNEKFPRGLAFVADRIRDAGFLAGIWTAPFSAVRHSRLLEAHPDWALRGDDGEWLRGTLNPQWSPEGWCYALDPTRPDFVRHVEDVHRALAEMGFAYQKLDFLYMAAMRGRSADPTLSRAARLRAGLEAVRRGAGDDAFLLGCGCPMGPAVGVVDGMRIGPDVAPIWAVDPSHAIPGLEPAMPATGSAVRSIGARLFMHRRLWLNDPDCLMVRRHQTALSPDEIGCLADAIAVSGGMVVFSDDVDLLGPEDAARLRRTLAGARAVDAAAPWGTARRTAGPTDAEPAAAPTSLEAAVGTGVLRAALNLGDAETRGPAGAALAPHASRMDVAHATRPVAVFCDFDGTFIDRDVGSGLARRYLGPRRETLWQRFERGELDAWAYLVELFAGFDLPERDRIAFLDAVEIDPGAATLVDLCRARGWPFEVLSDGFDANIEHLRARFGVDFGFRANHLEIGPGGWKLAPGGRPTDCACGTGTCKRRAIEAFRAERPDAITVHVGNGRVSDLCGALAADWAFAKDSLAPALAAAGRGYLPFVHLGDVADALDRWLVRAGDGPPLAALAAGRS